MRKRWWAGLALFLCTASVLACINPVGTDKRGNRFRPGLYLGDDLTRELRLPTSQRYWLATARETIDQARKKPTFRSLTGLGIVLVYQGQYDQAIRLFLALERQYPGHHETAANLGTALELAGHDAAALRWIRIGIRRNAQEHYGTEWLYARILEAKIAMAKDPSYLEGHSIAGVTFDHSPVPQLPKRMPIGNTGSPVTPRDLNLALNYQLFERTAFVRPPDPVVANLLMDWATLNLAGGPIENADALYDLAVDYGASEDALMRQRKAYIQRVLAKAGNKEAGVEAWCPICAPRPED